MSKRITVHSYNILSPKYCTPKIFQQCDIKNLDSSTRFSLIKQKLEKSVNENAFICLQEVSQAWKEDLISFLKIRNYNLLLANYSDHMGVGIAYPHNEYELKSKKILTLGYNVPVKWEIRMNKMIDLVIQNAKQKPNENYLGIKKPKVIPQDWEVSLHRKNKIISASFTSKNDNKEFCIGNYHMPCFFKRPGVMLLHTSLCAKFMQNFSKNRPYILAGDFNFDPNSPPYKLLTNGVCSLNIDNWSNSKFSLGLKDSMKSAYYQFLGEEPEFTNFPGLSFYFKKTLDYFFYSPNFFTVSDIVVIPEVSSKNRLPNELEPSDHVLIGAVFDMNEDVVNEKEITNKE